NHEYGSSKLLIHKIYTINQLRKLRRTDSKLVTSKIHWLYLIYSTVRANVEYIFSLNNSNFSKDVPTDMSSKDSARKVFVHYLESLLTKFPKSDLIRLYIIYYYAEKLKMYGVAMKIIADIKQNGSSVLLFNVSLILYDIQNLTNS